MNQFADWLVRLDLASDGFKNMVKSKNDADQIVSLLFETFQDGILLAKLACKVDPSITEDQIKGRAVFWKDKKVNIKLLINACKLKKIKCDFKWKDLEEKTNINGLMKTLHQVAEYLNNNQPGGSCCLQPFPKIPKFGAQTAGKDFHLENPYKEFREKSARLGSDNIYVTDNFKQGEEIYEKAIDVKKSSSSTKETKSVEQWQQAIDELFSTEKKYKEKLRLFMDYAVHSENPRITGPLSELQEKTLCHVLRLHEEVKNCFEEHSNKYGGFQEVLIEKKRSFLIYGPFIVRCRNIMNEIKKLPLEEKVAPQEKIGTPTDLLTLLVLPMQHVLR